MQRTVKDNLSAGKYLCAYQQVQDFWRSQPGSAVAPFVLAFRDQTAAYLPLTPVRVAVLRSFTVEPMIPLLRASGFVEGIDITAYVGAFNAWAQALLDAGSALYRFDPDIVILALQTRDIAPALWNWADPDAGQNAIDGAFSEIGNAIQRFRARHRAALVIHDFEVPSAPAQGILDDQQSQGQISAIHTLNTRLRSLAASLPNVYVLGYDALVARYGRLRWHDEQKWLAARLPISAECLIHMAEEWVRFLGCLTGRVAKVIVTDLDNTLWGGVAGEDGPAGIQIGPEYPGVVFQQIQAALLECRRRGILLAIASKNNPRDALEILENHPGMLLRPSDFSALRIGWNDKADSLREIASELNVGLDSLAFLDDNPMERDRIRQELPEVQVIHLPASPLLWPDLLRRHIAFQRLALSKEDLERPHYYAQQKERENFATGSASIEEFYRGLQQEVELFEGSPATAPRLAQLTAKTNQFNLTTRRYSEQDVLRMLNMPGWSVYGASVRDRFGDNGIVATIIVHRTGRTLDIDTFLLSCRVIGRTVETAILAFLVEEARMAGCDAIRGRYIPTAKNQPAADFFDKHGFVPVEDDHQGVVWVLNLSDNLIRCPDWITLVHKESAISESAVV